MSVYADLQAELAELDRRIASYASDYAGEEYAKFITNGGCLNCDGAGAVLFDKCANPFWLACPSCEGKTESHPQTFYTIKGAEIVLQYEKYNQIRALNLSNHLTSAFYSSAAESARIALVAKRSATFNRLIAQPDPNDGKTDIQPGDKVLYKGQEHTVFWSGRDNYTECQRLGIRPISSTARDFRKDGIFLDSTDVQVIKSLTAKLPALSGVSAAQRKYADQCRRGAINAGRVDADTIVKQTTSKYWLDNFKNLA
jgi:hypothetical protein